MDKITNHRQRINAIDDQIMSLLDERFALSETIGAEKRASNKPITDHNREALILQKTSPYHYSHAIHTLYKELMTISKSLQK